MSNTTPPILPEHRVEQRRAEDRAVDILHKTFSTPHCHACLERLADGVLLLDNDLRVIFATPEVDQVLKKHGLLLALEPEFSLLQLHHASRFAAFVNEKNHEAGPLSLLLESENSRDMMLLNCFRFPKIAEPNLQIARYMIIFHDPSHYPIQQWQLFNKQFNLTPAELRLCHMFADGLTLSDYCEKWHVTTSTARSQLHSIFEKTSTHRQSDLLRLIFLFSRTY